MLRVLVTADELVRAAQVTAQVTAPSQGGADSDGADAGAGVTDGGLHSLLRLQALRACVAVEAAEATEAVAVEVGSSAAADPPSKGRGAGTQLTRSLLQLLDQRVGRLVETMREPLAARAAAALRGLGWPGEVAGLQQPGAAQAAVQAVREAFAALLLLQYCAQPYSAAQQPPSQHPTLAGAAASSALGSGTGPLWAVEAMVQPVLRRFRFHFEGRRETNRHDTPNSNYHAPNSKLSKPNPNPNADPTRPDPNPNPNPNP